MQITGLLQRLGYPQLIMQNGLAFNCVWTFEALLFCFVFVQHPARLNHRADHIQNSAFYSMVKH